MTNNFLCLFSIKRIWELFVTFLCVGPFNTVSYVPTFHCQKLRELSCRAFPLKLSTGLLLFYLACVLILTCVVSGLEMEAVWSRRPPFLSSLSLPTPSSPPLRSKTPSVAARESGRQLKLPERVRADPGRQTYFGAF